MINPNYGTVGHYWLLHGLGLFETLDIVFSCGIYERKTGPHF